MYARVCVCVCVSTLTTLVPPNQTVVSVVGWGTASINGHWSWRTITFIQCVPSLIQLVGIWWIPESPRFLVSKDKPEQALEVLAKHHGGGDPNDALVQFQFREIKEAIQADSEIKRSTRYSDFFRTRGNLWRLAIIISLGVISQYSGNAIFSNYMDVVYQGAGITAQNQKLALTAGKNVLDLSTAITAALLVDKFGRRPLFLISAAGMAGSFAMWTVTGAVYENSEVSVPVSDMFPEGVRATNQAAGYAQLPFIWIFGIFYSMGFSGLLVAYALEVLPFHLRAKGMMIMNITVQAILALGKYVRPRLLPHCHPSLYHSANICLPPCSQTNKLAWQNLPNHWNFMLFYTLWDTVEFIFVYFVYPETKGTTLEEVARIFDGEDAVGHIDFEQVEKEVQLQQEVQHFDKVAQ